MNIQEVEEKSGAFQPDLFIPKPGNRGFDAKSQTHNPSTTLSRKSVSPGQSLMQDR